MFFVFVLMHALYSVVSFQAHLLSIQPQLVSFRQSYSGMCSQVVIRSAALSAVVQTCPEHPPTTQFEKSVAHSKLVGGCAGSASGLHAESAMTAIIKAISVKRPIFISSPS